MILEDELFRRARVGGPEMVLEPALPVAVAQRRRARGEQELARHEEVVRHRVRGQVGQIAEAEGAQRIGMSQVENLLAHVPGVTMSTHGRVRSEEHTSELQSRLHLVCRLLLEKKKHNNR